MKKPPVEWDVFGGDRRRTEKRAGFLLCPLSTGLRDFSRFVIEIAPSASSRGELSRGVEVQCPFT
jgi:hypothetical protein